ncbi:HAD family hydrolase [Streptococcus mitis]|uniref:phosphoserine phosphatase n=1 Tax=Streptococcus mitis TaxID=28037 RepID=A0A3R9K4C1_STRMT|nr:HAD-IB family hydrolase [Streptococcus mitis]MBZ2105689.1 HAD-IB family hydrolase [Streptococcus mitis]MBZ2109257.1 HAD-IB family hydrolase [Streptococcus mitis]RSI95993.1 haloacid dehalogenase-like hydrolase [Streptococcus mitis]
MSQEIAAIFDIDGTIFRDSLLIHHMEKCIAYDVFPISVEMELKPHKNAWQNRELDYDDYLYKASKLYTKYISNKDILDIEFVAKKVIEKGSKKLYRFTRDRIKWYKEQGHKIIFISGSPDFLVEKMAEKLGADLWFASQYLNDCDKYSGEVIPMWDSVSKLQVLKQLSINFEESYAYGDTTGDFTMLQSVGYPTAINPNKKLLDMIRKEKLDCNIIIERKDVIYKLDELGHGIY